MTFTGVNPPAPVTYSDVYLNDAGSATGGIFGVYQNVSFGSAITFNASVANVFNLTLSGNNTSSVVLNPQQTGQVIVINFCQDGSGNRVFTFPPNFVNTTSFVSISPIANRCTPTQWYYNGTSWVLMSALQDSGAFNYVSLPFNATPVFTAGVNTIFDFTLTGNVTSSTFTSTGVPGTIFQMDLLQDGTGGRTFAFPGNVVLPTGFSFDTVAGHHNQVAFRWNGTIWDAWNVIGSGGTTSPGSPLNSLQKNAAGIFGASSESDDGTNFRVPLDTIFTGPNPWIDIRAFGAVSRNANIAPAVPGITANCVNGNASVVLSSASTFVNSEGVTLWGCGAANGLSTPGTPTVTPSNASGPTVTGMVVNSPAGATSYQYQIVAMTTGGGFTPAGTAGTTTTGQASLGAQSVNITSLSKVNNIVTVVTASAHGLSVGTAIDIKNTSASESFGGWYLVATVPDNTHFTYTTPVDARAGIYTNSATGGTVTWWSANHVTWTTVTNAWIYLIYGRTAGSNVLIGVSKPQNVANAIFDPSWDDFGATITPPPTVPSYIPNTPPVSAFNNHLTTTITSGAGTTTLVLAAAPSNTKSGTTILSDVGPNMVAAAALTHNIMLPNNTGFVVNSFTTLSNSGGNGTVSILQLGGALQINSTLSFPGSIYWYGNSFPGPFSVPSFAMSGGAPVFGRYSFPLVFSGNAGGSISDVRGLSVAGVNNAIQWVNDNSSSFMFKDMTFAGSGGPNPSGMLVLIRNLSFQAEITNLTILGDQNAVASTPVLFCNGCSSARFNLLNLSGGGIALNAGFVSIDHGRIQGSVMPTFMVMPLFVGVGGVGSNPGGETTLQIKDYEIDTGAHPLVSNFNPGNTNSGTVLIQGGRPIPSNDSGGVVPTVTGTQFNGITMLDSPTPSSQTEGGLIVDNSASGIYGGGSSVTTYGHPAYGREFPQGQLLLTENLNVAAGNGITINFPVPVITPTVITGGACILIPPAGTFYYYLTVVGPDNVESTPGPYSNPVTLNGTTQCTQLDWPHVAGVLGYRVYVGLGKTGGGLISQGTCNGNTTLLTVNSCVDTHQFTNAINATLNGTGNPSLYPGLLSTNKFIFGSISTGNFGSLTETGNFTALRTRTKVDFSGPEMVYSGSFTNNDCVKALVSGGVTSFTTSGTGCSGGGTVNNSPQFSAPYYSLGGSSNVLSGIIPPTTNDLWFYSWNVTANAALAPSLSRLGAPISTQTGNFTLDSSGSNRANLMLFNTCTTPTLTIPNTLTGNYPFRTTNNCSGNLILSATAPNTINGGSAGGNIPILPNWTSSAFQDNSSNWRVDRYPLQEAFPTICTIGIVFSASTGFSCGATTTVGGVNSQTTNYTAVAGDGGKIVSMNGASVTLTLPASPPAAPWGIFVENVNASSLTVSRNGLNIDGAAANLTLTQNQGVWITHDGSNYFTSRGVGGAGGGGSPGGSSTQLQYNNASAFGGIADLTFNGSHTIALGAAGILDLSAASATAGLKAPTAAGAAPTTASVISYDSTKNEIVFGNGITTIPAGVLTQSDYFQQEEWTGSAVAGNLQGWQCGVGTCNDFSAVAGHYGVISVETGTTISTIVRFGERGTGNNGDVYPDIHTTVWLNRWVAKLAGAACTGEACTINAKYRLGIMDAWGTDPPSSGWYFEAVEGATNNSNIKCVTNNAGTATSTDSGIVLDTNWHEFKIFNNGSGSSSKFYIDGNLVCTNTTNLPVASPVFPDLQIVNTSANSKVTDLDYWSMYIATPR